MFPFHLFMFLFLLSCIFLLIFMSDNIWLVARYYEFYLAGLEYVCILKLCAWILLSYLGTVFIPFDLVIQTRSSIFTRTNFPYYWGKAILQRLSNTSWTVRFSLFLVVKKKKKYRLMLSGLHLILSVVIFLALVDFPTEMNLSVPSW